MPRLRGLLKQSQLVLGCCQRVFAAAAALAVVVVGVGAGAVVALAQTSIKID